MADPKITDVRLMRIDPYKGSGPNPGYWNLIRVDTDQGLWGLGEAYWGPGLRSPIEELLKPLLLGDNPLDVDRLFTTMQRRLGGAHALNGLVMAAISGIEIALWDLAGKLTGLPAYRLLGGKFRDRVRLYRVGTPPGAEDLSVCEEYAAELAEPGYTAIKTIDADSLWQRYDPECREPGHEPMGRNMTPGDLKLAEQIMSNMRRAFGDDCGIAVHCHWALDLRDALALAECTAPYRPMWLEDPLPVAFGPEWVHLTRASPVPICMGENLYGKHEFRPFVEERGTDIVQVDVPKSGGLLETKRIADMADTHYMQIAAHNPASPVGTMATVQVAAAIRGFTMMEMGWDSKPWWQDLILHDGPLVQDGHIAVPEGPGLGIELNPDEVQKRLADGDEYWGE